MGHSSAYMAKLWPICKSDTAEYVQYYMKKLTLSFDNGPSSKVTPKVLDVLATFGVKTTFFVCGQKLLNPAEREIAARARALGHWIGNHTFTHTIPLGNATGRMVAESEIGRTQELY